MLLLQNSTVHQYGTLFKKKKTEKKGGKTRGGVYIAHKIPSIVVRHRKKKRERIIISHDKGIHTQQFYVTLNMVRTFLPPVRTESQLE